MVKSVLCGAMEVPTAGVNHEHAVFHPATAGQIGSTSHEEDVQRLLPPRFRREMKRRFSTAVDHDNQPFFQIGVQWIVVSSDPEKSSRETCAKWRSIPMSRARTTGPPGTLRPVSLQNRREQSLRRRVSLPPLTQSGTNSGPASSLCLHPRHRFPFVSSLIRTAAHRSSKG